MKIILNDFVAHLGAPGDQVDVAPGYARNYLLPKKLAFEATAGNVRTYENNLKQRAKKLARILVEAEAQKAKLDGEKLLSFERRAGEEGKLFGSVTSADIEETLTGRGYVIEKKQIELKVPIKIVGETDVIIKIHSQVKATIKVVVSAENKEGALVPGEAAARAAEAALAPPEEEVTEGASEDASDEATEAVAQSADEGESE